MKIFLALVLTTFSIQSFSQDKIPAVDINNPPNTPPTMSVSTVEEVAPAPVEPVVAKANGCTMPMTGISSLFRQDKKLFKKITPLDIDGEKQTMKQGVIVGNGIEIRFVKAFCTHNILVLNFVPKRVQNNQPQHLYRQTMTLLTMKDFQIANTEYATLAPLVKSLVRNNWSQIIPQDGQHILPCVGAKCTLKVIQVGGVDKEIELTYDSKLD